MTVTAEMVEQAVEKFCQENDVGMQMQITCSSFGSARSAWEQFYRTIAAELHVRVVMAMKESSE